MNPTLKQVNKLVLAFLDENKGAANLEELWMDSVNQKQVKNLLSRASRPPKDPQAPKRGKSSYLFYCQDNRDKVKKDLGEDSKATDVTKELGKRWNALKKDKKSQKKLQEYEALAAADKKRYEKEKSEYTPPDNLVSGRKNGPKRAKSAYLFFCDDFRSKVKKELGEDSKATDVTKELGKRWNALKADDGTGKYDKLAEKDRERYQQEKNVLSDTDELLEKKAAPKKAAAKKSAPKKISAPKKGKKSSTNKSVGKSSGRTGYQVFCTENRPSFKKDNPDASGAEVTKKLSAAWKALSKKAQEKYKESA